MKRIWIAFLLASSSAHAVNRSVPTSVTFDRAGAVNGFNHYVWTAYPVINGQSCTSLGLGSTTGTATFSPSSPTATMAVVGENNGPTQIAISTWRPLAWYALVPEASQTEPTLQGSFDPITGAPVDDNGNLVDLGNGGQALPGQPARLGLELTNPFSDRGFSFEVDVIQGGEVVGTQRFDLAPGQTLRVPMSDDQPFTAVAYPIVEGVRSPTPYTSGSSTGGTVGAPSTPIDFGTNNSGTTKPTTQPTTTTKGENHTATQNAIDRLGTIMTANTDATKQGTTFLGGKLDQIKQAIDAGNAKLGQIATNTASGGPSGPSDAATRDDVEDAVSDAIGNGATGSDAATTEETQAAGTASDIGTKIAGIRASLDNIGDKAGELVDRLGLGTTTFGSSDWIISMDFGPFGGSRSINIEQWGWILDLIRGTTLGMICMHFVGKFILAIRSAFV